ncbi:MAG: patatin-like phospholipase family protein [Oligoflexus sp.]
MQNKYGPTLGLVLSGGGARGAYQAGVMKGVAEIWRQSYSEQNPFPIITGVSAGSINACYLASQADRFYDGVSQLADFWSNIRTEQVFRTDVWSLGRNSMSWIQDIIRGRVHSSGKVKALLDTGPLRRLLEEKIDCSKIKSNLQAGHLRAVAMSATNYRHNTNITFVEVLEKDSSWKRVRRSSENTSIDISHIMASAAIPLFFPPIPIDGSYFGDGCMRNMAPLSPAIRLGADRLFIAGVKYDGDTHIQNTSKPSVARVLGVLLNAVFMDGIETDIERLSRINKTLRYVDDEDRRHIPLRPIDYVHIHPSEDLASYALAQFERLPLTMQYLFQGLGSKEEGAELISYLLFEPTYCGHLVELGYQDAMAMRYEIEDFLLSTRMRETASNAEYYR